MSRPAAALVDVTPLRTSPDFRRLWLGGLIAGLGAQMASVAVLHRVWEATGSPLWTGAIGIARPHR